MNVHTVHVTKRNVFLVIMAWILGQYLQGLTQVEEMLISAVIPMMSLYTLPLGQYGYSGHVVNLPQDRLIVSLQVF